MQTITIGDIHGRDLWKTIDPFRYDRIIFLGDYVDSHTVRDEQMLINLRDIIRFRKTYPEKVVLLTGNHEISYLLERYRCSGYRPSIATEVVFLLKTYRALFSAAYQAGDYLWTHAGLRQDFYDKKIRPKILEEDENLEATLNRLFNARHAPVFEIGPQRGGSPRAIGGPLWLDRSALVRNPLRGYHQVVGHTPVPTLYYHQPYPDDPSTSVTFCDCLEYGDNSFYECEIPGNHASENTDIH
jgi:hypothetical protein